MLRPMFIAGLAVDHSTDSPIVILEEVFGERTLLIWIGLIEATAIASELAGFKLCRRPLTHDLLKNILDLMDMEVSKVEICDLKNSTYHALIYMEHKGQEILVDARPSDALALSLRFNAPIFVAEDVIQKSKQVHFKSEATNKSEQGRKWQDILENLDPEAFGKYKM